MHFSVTKTIYFVLETPASALALCSQPEMNGPLLLE
jgi:hypothetical protein